MAGSVKNREKTERTIGWITLGAAIVLLIFAAIFMQRCSADVPGENSPSESTDSNAHPTDPIAPALEANPYGPSDFVHINGYLTCKDGSSMLGVDVSYYQGDIDWAQVARSDVEFAMIRIGRRFADSGTIQEDPTWRTNLQEARENGLLVGVYFFSQAINPEEAREEAEFVLELLDGISLDLPVAFDWEFMGEDARTAHMDADTLSACAQIFSETVAQAGYTPMVYFNLDFSNRMLDLAQLQQAGCYFWLAMYSDSMTYENKINMWQYSEGGTVAGISGDVDLNLYFDYSK